MPDIGSAHGEACCACQSPGVRVLSFRAADALIQKLVWMSCTRIPKVVAGNVPEHDNGDDAWTRTMTVDPNNNEAEEACKRVRYGEVGRRDTTRGFARSTVTGCARSSAVADPRCAHMGLIVGEHLSQLANQTKSCPVASTLDTASVKRRGRIRLHPARRWVI